MKSTIYDIVYLEELRQRIGLEENDSSKDDYILSLPPFRRVELLCGWHLGSESWASSFKRYCESQGVYLTTNQNAEGIF